MGAGELARHRKKQLSPRGDRRDDRADRERNPSSTPSSTRARRGRRARQTEEALAKGKTGPSRSARVMKDLFDFAGWPATRWDPDERLHPTPTACGPSMEAAAIIVGKTNSPAMAIGACDNYPFAVQPFDVTRNSGGSGIRRLRRRRPGSAAEGTDGGGSIRSRRRGADLFQPSPSRVPTVLRPNASPASPHIYEGPSPARRRRCPAMEVLPDTTPRLSPTTTTPISHRSPTGTSPVGRSPTARLRRLPAAPEVREVVEARWARGLRVEVTSRDLDRPDQREPADLWCRLIMPFLDSFANLKQAGLDTSVSTAPISCPSSAVVRPRGADVGIYFDDNSKTHGV